MKHPTHGGNLRWAAARAGCSPDQILDFSASISPLGPPDCLGPLLSNAQPWLIRYPDPDYRDLREAIATHHAVTPEQVLPGNGAAELLTWAVRDCQELRQVWRLSPGFADYDRALDACGIHPRDLPLDLPQPETLDLSPALEDQPESSALLLNNPHNPSGACWSLVDRLPELARFAQVIVDEAFMDFLPPAQQPSLIPALAQLPNLVVLRSLTKFYSLPGLRLGYALGQPEQLQRWQQWRDPWSINGLAAAAAPLLLGDRDFQQRTWDWLPPARESLRQQLNAIPGLQALPGTTNFLLVASEHSVVALQTDLLEQFRILIRDCRSFAGLGDRWFRIAVRLPEENRRLVEALTEVCR